MANADKNILITPNKGSTSDNPKIEFVGADASTGPQTITLRVYPTNNGTISIEGSAGQLFSITNSLDGVIYSVNDISGIPSIQVIDTGLVKIAEYSGNVVIGSATDNGTDKLQVTGSISSTGNITAPSFVGNASTATILQNARTIGGVSFNGSANINLPGVNTAGNQNTTGNAATASVLQTARTIGGVSFNGSANINLPGVNTAGNQNTTGNAATASVLQTARTINGVSFNGSANITVADSTKQPLDADLTAIAALTGTSGLLRKTAANTWSLDTAAYVTSSGVTSVSGTAPIVSSGGTTPAISISAATTSAAGSMSAADKTKLDGIAAGAQVNVATNLTYTTAATTGTVNSSTGTNATVPAATTTLAGLMTGADKTKLDGVAAGSTANTGTVTSVGGTGGYGGLTLTGTVTTSGNLTLGGTPTGSWPISVSGSSASTTGNAATATKLATARTINGVSFDGTANITVAATDATKMPLTGGTLSGRMLVNTSGNIVYEDNGGVYIPRPQNASYKTTNSSHTGAIAIQLPTALYAASDMMSFWVDVYDYTSNESVSIYIYGYAYGTNTGNWTNTGATTLTSRTDRDYNVRFCHDGTRHVVCIGETTSTWAYPQIMVRDFQAGYSASADTLDDGWAIIFLTTLPTVMATNSGNTVVAKQLQTARTIGGVAFDGSANINLPGVNTTGNQSTTGNSATATALQTARTINGTSFNGSANITTANWGTARTLTVGNTGKSVNGSANVAWSLSEIGAYAATNPSGYTSNTGTVTSVGGTGGYGGLTLSGTVTTTGNLTLGGTPTGTWPISISGNAATATTATTSTFVSSPDGDRVAGNKLPTSNPRTVRFDFANANSVTGATGNYAGVMTYAPWDGTTASTGDSSYQLAFANQSGVNASGPAQLLLRNGINSTWNSWQTLLSSSNYSSYAMPSGSSATNSVDVRAPIFYDSNNTGYYLDPASSGLSLKVNGNIEIVARSASWAEGIRVRSTARGTWAGLRFTRDDANNNGNWAIGYTGIDSTDDLTFWGNLNGSESTKARMDLSANFTIYGSTRSPIFYDSIDTGYYVDPNSTGDAALRMRGGALFGPNTTWGAYLLVGGDGRQNYTNSGYASVCTTNGNLHLDSGSSYTTHINWYDGVDLLVGAGDSSTLRFKVYGNDNYSYASGSMRSPIFYDNDNTGYYVNPASTSSLNAINVNSGNFYGSTYFISNRNTTSDSAPLQAYSNNLSGAIMSFHRAGSYAVNFGLDSDNVMRIGGWSAPANRWELDMSGNNWVASSSRAPIFYDSNDTAYYVDPNTTGTSVNVAGAITANGGITGNVDVRTPILYDSSNSYYFADLSSGGTSIRALGNIITSGSITAGGNITASSDRRIKKDIQTILDPIEKVKLLNGVTFSRIDLEDKDTRYAGLIAQDVEAALPEAVFEDTLKRVDYNAVIGLLVESIKKQQEEIDKLKALINI